MFRAYNKTAHYPLSFPRKRESRTFSVRRHGGLPLRLSLGSAGDSSPAQQSQKHFNPKPPALPVAYLERVIVFHRSPLSTKSSLTFAFLLGTLSSKGELLWEGKYDQFGNRRSVDIAGCSMPMQRIETTAGRGICFCRN
jgi:hypothetical protein